MIDVQYCCLTYFDKVKVKSSVISVELLFSSLIRYLPSLLFISSLILDDTVNLLKDVLIRIKVRLVESFVFR